MPAEVEYEYNIEHLVLGIHETTQAMYVWQSDGAQAAMVEERVAHVRACSSKLAYPCHPDDLRA